jgi:hypothetical protein
MSMAVCEFLTSRFLILDNLSSLKATGHTKRWVKTQSLREIKGDFGEQNDLYVTYIIGTLVVGHPFLSGST